MKSDKRADEANEPVEEPSTEEMVVALEDVVEDPDCFRVSLSLLREAALKRRERDPQDD